MKQWLYKVGLKLSAFMRGRHGDDKFNRFLYFISCIFLILSMFGLKFMLIPAVALMGYSWFRFLSRNEYARQKELRAYLRISGKFTGWFRIQKNKWRDRKTHNYYRCPACKASVRIHKPPRGKSITIHCPACGKDFNKRT